MVNAMVLVVAIKISIICVCVVFVYQGLFDVCNVGHKLPIRVT
jgi:hypothetical protein